MVVRWRSLVAILPGNQMPLFAWTHAITRLGLHRWVLTLAYRIPHGAHGGQVRGVVHCLMLGWMGRK